MPLRQSIAYNKNLLTGEMNVLTKMKPIAPVRGMAKVQLIDAENGKVIYEAHTENIINSIVAKYAFMEFFYFKLKGETSKSYFQAPFDYLLLTDYEGEEDPQIKYYRGSVIGYANKNTTYIGNSNVKGTINVSESDLDVNGTGLIHFVFDFPTNAANGTFNTIWWVSELSKGMKLNKSFSISCTSIREDNYNYAGSNYPSVCMFRSQNKWVCIIGKGNSESHLSVFKPFYALILNDDFTFYKCIELGDKLSTKFTNVSCGFGCSNNGVVIINGYEKSNNVAIIDIDTEQITYLSIDTSEIGYQSIYINIIDNKIYISGQKFCEYVINGSSVTLIKNYGDAIPYFFAKIDNKIAFLNTNNRIAYIENGMVKESAIAIESYYYERHMVFRPDNSDVGYVLKNISVKDGYDVTLTVEEYITQPIVGAQTLLASPVTKTPTNTMKIQYDFQIEKIL